MITHWSISNFKSIREQDKKLELAPFTIFSGANSSGKSSLIKSILTVSQSFASPISEEPLVLNGGFVRLGHFEDVLHHGQEDKPIKLQMTLDLPEGGTIEVDVVIQCQKRESEKKGVQRTEHLYAQVQECDVRLVKDDKRDGEELSLQLRLRRDLVQNETQQDELNNTRPIIRTEIANGLFEYAIEVPESSDLISNNRRETVISAGLNNLLPERLLIRFQTTYSDIEQEIDMLMEELKDLPPNYIDRNRPLSEATKIFISNVVRREQYKTSWWSDEFVQTIDDMVQPESRWTLEECGRALKRRKFDGAPSDLANRLKTSTAIIGQLLKGTPIKNELQVRLFPSHYSQMIDRVRRDLGSGVYYLGPLRDDPKVIYAMPPLPNQRDVGSKGEYTAAMLDIYGNVQLEDGYPEPPPTTLKAFSGSYEWKEGTLIEGVQDWAERMGLATSVNAAEAVKIGYRLGIQAPGLAKELDLMSVGFGVSQVLPILVLGLLAPKRSILIFEQPEVHLHPKVQSVLGDFFLALTTCGKQCLVETHSVYLIERTRLRIAQAPGEDILKNVRFYFVRREKAESKFDTVEPNRYGAIPDWPAEFFDELEGESASILRAAQDKRITERTERKGK